MGYSSGEQLVSGFHVVWSQWLSILWEKYSNLQERREKRLSISIKIGSIRYALEPRAHNVTTHVYNYCVTHLAGTDTYN
jgi:hypothetical protein